MSTPTVAGPAAGLLTHDVLGSMTSVRLSGDETGGVLSLYEVNDRTGIGIPLHVHEHEDELFHVISGRVRFELDGKETIAGANTTVFGPRGIPHAWTVIEPCRMLVQVTPAGMERMFEELGALDMPPNPHTVGKICASYGITFA